MSREIYDQNDLLSGSSIQESIPLLNDRTIARGLVTSGDQFIVNNATRRPLWKAMFLPLVGAGKKSTEIFQRLKAEEFKALAQDLEGKGMLGPRPLLRSQLLRERVDHSGGSFSGSILGMSGSFESSSDYASRVLFAWQTEDNRMIISQVDVQKIEIALNETSMEPTIEFEFEANRLVSQPISAKGALVRQWFGHPNGYINNALVKATLRAGNEAELNDFFVPLKMPT